MSSYRSHNEKERNERLSRFGGQLFVSVIAEAKKNGREEKVERYRQKVLGCHYIEEPCQPVRSSLPKFFQCKAIPKEEKH